MGKAQTLPHSATLRTPRCRLRRIAASDAESVYRALSTEGFTDSLLQDPLASLDEGVALIERYLDAWDEGIRFVFAITSHAGEFLGIVNLFKRDTPGLWSLGFWIMPEHWGCGYAEEAARATIDLAFGEVGADVVHAAHVHWNQQSERVLRKLGMRFTFRREQGIQKNGEWVPNLHYEVAKSEWGGS